MGLEEGNKRKKTERQLAPKIKRQSRDDLGEWWNRIIPALTPLSVVLDVNGSIVVSDDVLPEDPGPVTQVLVVDNLHSSLQNLCEVVSEKIKERERERERESRQEMMYQR